MKVYIGGNCSCNVHNEKGVLKYLINNYGYTGDVELSKDISDADLIIYIDSCVGSEYMYYQTLYKLAADLHQIKRGAEVILSGCLANRFKVKLPSMENDFLSQFEKVSSSNIISYVLKRFKILVPECDKIYTKISFNIDDERVFHISPVQGCINNCSFCKKSYIDFKLRSIPFDKLKELAERIGKLNEDILLSIMSSNFTLYGVDFGYQESDKSLQHRQLAHEVIRLFTDLDNVKLASVGTLINFYPELIDEIIRNRKIFRIYSSLETGSPRLYNTMNRPISLNDWISTIRRIRSERPEILILSEIIVGYPGETLEDAELTIKLCKELGLYVYGIWPYIDSQYIPSGSLQNQYKMECKTRIRKYYEGNLAEHNNAIWEQWKDSLR